MRPLFSANAAKARAATPLDGDRAVAAGVQAAGVQAAPSAGGSSLGELLGADDGPAAELSRQRACLRFTHAGTVERYLREAAEMARSSRHRSRSVAGWVAGCVGVLVCSAVVAMCSHGQFTSRGAVVLALAPVRWSMRRRPDWSDLTGIRQCITSILVTKLSCATVRPSCWWRCSRLSCS
eukprot:COSAG01_NODE_15233_length_1358_cov_16.763304_1_plen_180_part_00